MADRAHVDTNSLSTDEADVLARARVRLRDCMVWWSNIREKYLEDVNFGLGRQWTDEEKEKRTAAGQLTRTINKLPAHMKQVINDARQSTMAIELSPTRFDPMVMPDGERAKSYEMSTALAGLVRSIEHDSRARRVVYPTAVTCSVRGGYGWIRVLVEDVDDEIEDLRRLTLKRVRNPRNVVCDPGFTEPDASDANYGFVMESITKADFERDHPGKDFPGTDLDDTDVGQYWARDDDHVVICEYYERQRIDDEVVLLSDGRTNYFRYLTETKRSGSDVSILDELEADGITIEARRKVKRWRVMGYLLSYSQILEGPDEFPSKYIPLALVPGVEVAADNEIHYESLIRHSIDAQVSFNHWRSAADATVEQAAQAPWLLTTEQIKGYEKQWDAAGTVRTPYLLWNYEQGQPDPKRVDVARSPVGEIGQAQLANDDIKATIGQFDPSLGDRSNETSGVAIMARQRQGDVSSHDFHAGLGIGVEHAARIIVDAIPRVYDTERVLRMIMEDRSEGTITANKPMVDSKTGETIIVNDLSRAKYLVSVSVGPGYDTLRQEASDSMERAMGVSEQAGLAMIDLYFRNQDWPGAQMVADRVRKLLPAEFTEGDDGGEARQPTPDELEAQARIAEAQARIAESQLKMRELSAGSGDMDDNEFRDKIAEVVADLLGPQLEGQAS